MHPTCAKPHRTCLLDPSHLAYLTHLEHPPQTAQSARTTSPSFLLPAAQARLRVNERLTSHLCAPPPPTRPGRPHRLPRSLAPSTPKQFDLTACSQLVNGSGRMPVYQGIYTYHSYPYGTTQPRGCTQLYCAAHWKCPRSMCGSPKMACPVQPHPRPASLLRHSAMPMDMAANPYLTIPFHTMPDTCLGSSSYNRRCRQFKATTLAYWHT